MAMARGSRAVRQLVDKTSPPHRKPPTLYDVAHLAGVSHQTVSRLVKGHTNIRDDIRIRVEAAISALNYRPNLSARSLATSRPHRIGALVHETWISEIGTSKIIQGMSSGARDAGFLFDIVSLDPSSDRAIEQAISLINQHDFAGVTVFAPTDPVLRALDKVQFSVPLYVEVEANESPDSTRPTPNELGVRTLVGHLSDLGHQRYFHIAGPLDWPASRSRRLGYEQEISERGHRSLGVVEGDWTSQFGYDAVRSLPLDEITAIVSGNDQMALGALAALRERRIRVPQDVSVVGFDNIPESQFFDPPLTTVRLDFIRQGRIAISRLLQMINGDAAVTMEEPLVLELFVRESSGPARDISVR